MSFSTPDPPPPPDPPDPPPPPPRISDAESESAARQARTRQRRRRGTQETILTGLGGSEGRGRNGGQRATTLGGTTLTGGSA